MPIARFTGTNPGGSPTGATDTLGTFNPSGFYVQLLLDITNVPLGSMPGSNTVLMNGQTFNFQAFYRDTPAGSGTANFSTAFSIMFDAAP